MKDTKPCIHAEVCADGCDLEDITECGYYQAERTCKMHFNQIAGMMQCSECGEYTLLGVWQKDQGHLNWCANCGARVERDAS